MAHYPYSSELAKEVADAKKNNIPIEEWLKPGVTLQQLVNQLTGPILEIGGPTDMGYYFLHNIELPTEVIISNRAKGTMPFTPNAAELDAKIDTLIDGADLPYADNSVGMVLSAHLPIVDDRHYDFSHLTDDENAELNEKIKEAEVAIHQMATSGKVSEGQLAQSQRLVISKEVFAKLQPGGLYFTDATPDELCVHQLLGFEKIAEINANSMGSTTQDASPYYYVVLRKPMVL